MEPLPIADRPWESVTVDFITYLPKSDGYGTIMVVVDRFSEYASFMPATAGCTAKEAAKLIFKIVAIGGCQDISLVTKTRASQGTFGESCSGFLAQSYTSSLVSTCRRTTS